MILLKILEGIYYVAFIIFTFLLVVYAKNTYLLQSKRDSQLFCKVCLLEETLEGHCFAIEIYNHGNIVAKNIRIIIEGNDEIYVDFIKPAESYVYPIGQIVRTAGGNSVTLSSGFEIKPNEGLSLKLLRDEKSFDYRLNTDILFAKKEISVIHSIANDLTSISCTEQMRYYTTLG